MACQIGEVPRRRRVGLTEEWVLRSLRLNAVMTARRGDRAASNRAAELIGRQFGMFIDKKSVEISMVDDSDEYLRRRLEIVNAKVVENEPAPQQQLENGHDDDPELTES